MSHFDAIWACKRLDGRARSCACVLRSRRLYKRTPGQPVADAKENESASVASHRPAPVMLKVWPARSCTMWRAKGWGDRKRSASMAGGSAGSPASKLQARETAAAKRSTCSPSNRSERRQQDSGRSEWCARSQARGITHARCRAQAWRGTIHDKLVRHPQARTWTQVLACDGSANDKSDKSLGHDR